MTSYEKFARFYRIIALHTFNSFILILVVNLVMAGVLLISDPTSRDEPAVDRRVQTHREKFSDPEAYTSMSPEEVESFLEEQDVMGSIGFQHEPWVQFRNPEFHGRYLNTDARGFRKTKAPRRNPGTPVRIYVFGGSTTFGYGVADDYTIPSFMQTILERKHPEYSIVVENLGQGFYYSTQEMLLLISKIKDQDIPHLALFIDGANDTHQLHFMRDQPYFTDIATRLWNTRASVPSDPPKKGHSWIPMVRLAEVMSRKLERQGSPSNPGIPDRMQEAEQVSEQAILEANGPTYVARRYKNNLNIIRSICREHGIKCYFIWQPIPFYEYDRSLHRNFPYSGAIPGHWSATYQIMENYSSPDFLYLGEILRDVREKVFVDDVHYNEKYNEEIAAELCRFIEPDLNELVSRFSH